jgi:hypothetical protein
MKNQSQILKETNTMKTTKIFSVLSLALIFAAVTTSFSGNIETKKEAASVTSTLIRYQVNVSISSEKVLCNLYLVKIIDGQGRQVGPAKQYIPAISKYDFFEKGPVSGARIAVLVKYQYGDHYECEAELFTTPAALFGKFENGRTYRFDLFPTTQPSKE